MDLEVYYGFVVIKDYRDKVVSYINKGVEEGVEFLIDG